MKGDREMDFHLYVSGETALQLLTFILAGMVGSRFRRK
jgi:hypothetical protein